MKLFSLLRRFSKDKKGSTAITLGLTFTMVTGATIGAIEIEQMQRARSLVQDKMDATVLYIGSTGSNQDPQEIGEEYFQNAISASGLETVRLEPTFTYNPTSGEITGDVDFEIPGLMTGGLIPDKSLSVRSIASPKMAGRIEIAMVLDVSGSMGYSFTSNSYTSYPNRRIDGLQEAAADMFDIIYENPLAIPTVAVIPYAASVDITDLFASEERGTRISSYEGIYGESTNSMHMLHGLRMADIGEAENSLSGSYKEANVVDERDRTHTMGVWAAERYVSQNGDGTYNLSLDPPSGSNKMKSLHRNRFGPLLRELADQLLRSEMHEMDLELV